MAKEKQHVFSARTTEEGLRRLNELKAKLGLSWDGLVIDAMCAHYGLDRGVMAIPKRSKPDKPKAKARKSGRTKSNIAATTNI